MKKITLLFILVLSLTSVNAQILNQSASWPNAGWAVTGTYDAPSLLNDPTSSTNFSYDDDNAGSGSTDIVNAESPVIDLTTTHAGGETWISVEYDYDYNFGNVFNLEYYDADAASWITWEAISDNGSTTSNWCGAIAAPTVTSITLNIAGFTATQLSGFRYRFAYDSSSVFGWGMCVSSPTITSAAPPSCPDPTALGASPTDVTANLSWTENGTATTWDIEWGTTGFTATGTPTVNDSTNNPETITGLTPSTDYDFYVRADCGMDNTDVSAWVGPYTFTTNADPPPANDLCSSAVTVTVGVGTCGADVTGANSGATDSGVAKASCATATYSGGDIWYIFTMPAGETILQYSRSASAFSTTQVELYSGSCGALVEEDCTTATSNDFTGLTSGATYYLRLYDWSNDDFGDVTFCLGTPPPPPANDDCINATALPCGTTLSTETTAAATGGNASSCIGSIGDDVWYQFSGNDNTIELTVDATTQEAQVEVYESSDGTCSGFSLATCFDSAGTGGNPVVLNFAAAMGNEYFIRVGNWIDGDPAVEFSIGITCTTCGDPSDLGAINLATTSADLEWTENGFATTWDIEWGTEGFSPTGTPTINDTTNNPEPLTGLSPFTSYDFYVRADCGMDNTDVSTWVGPYTFETLATPPANDDCASATVLTINGDLACGVFASGTVNGATASGEGTTCTGTEDDDVWYSFVASQTSHVILVSNLAGSTTDMSYGLWEGTCGSLTNLQCTGTNSGFTATSLTPGNTYYVQAFTWSSSPQTTTFDICIGTLPAAPANDECDNAIALTVNGDLTCTNTTSGTTVSATASPQIDDITGTPDNDVWFSFVATGTEHAVLLTNITAVLGTNTDMGMGVYDGTGGCNSLVFTDDSDPNTLSLSGLTIGTTYYVRVYGWSSTSSAQVDFDICIGTVTTPSNDDCMNAITLNESTDYTCNMAVSGTTGGATNSSDYSTGCSATYNEVWYTFSPSTTGVYLLNRTLTLGTSSTYLSIWTGSCGGLTQLNSSCFSSSLTETLTAGTTYYISVATTNSGLVNFDLCIYPQPAAPANDDCVNAEAVSTLPYSTTLDAAGATNNAGFISDCGSGMNDGVWYTFTTVAGGTVDITVSNVLGWDPEVAIYSGSCGAFTCVDSADSGSSGSDESLTGVTVTAGTQYWINIGNFSGTTDNSEGPFALDISTTDTTTLGNNGLELIDFKYYPNPVSDILHLNAQIPIARISVFNILGKKVLELKPNANSENMDMSRLQSGIYFVNVTISNTSKTIKVIKK